MADPLIFISHKHSDRAIAEQLGKFFLEEAPKKLRVFLSSSPEFEGVHFGQSITKELTKALADADLFLLIYTSPDEDWSWCMWEWGVANHPQSAKTTMIVLQCGPQPPKVSEGTRRVNIKKLDEVQGFIKQYFGEPTMFPSLQQALAGHFDQDILEKKASRLHTAMSELIEDVTLSVEWPTWPFLQIDVPISTVNQMRDISGTLDREAQISAVREKAKISHADSKALGIFGLASLEANVPFSNIEKLWASAYPDLASPWFRNCCEQIVEAGSEKLPRLQPVTVRPVGGQEELVPVVTKVRRSGYLGSVTFDLFFLNTQRNTVPLVSSKMLRLNQFYWRPFSEKKSQETRLLDLSDDLKAQRKTRLPFLDDQYRIKYIVHRSTIDEFIVGSRDRMTELTLHDFFQDDNMHSMLQNTYEVFSSKATIEEARAVMTGKVRDIFVTDNGSRDEAVRGWLTNIDLGKEL